MRSTSHSSRGLGFMGINSSTVAMMDFSLDDFQIGMQTIQNHSVKLAFDRIDFDFFNHLFSKAISQHISSESRIDAAAFEIEKLVFVELAHGCSMRALYVIGKYFELRLGIHARFGRKQKILVCLLRVRLLRAMSHKNLAVKDRVRFSVEHTFVKLMTRTMRLAMIDYRMCIAVLARANH